MKKARFAFLATILWMLASTKMSRISAVMAQETDSISMMLTSVPMLFGMIIAAGVLGGIAFIFIAAADLMKRRRRARE